MLLKLSGEALQGDHLFGIDAGKLVRIAQEVHGATQLGVQVALVVGGGNLIRGAEFCAAGFNRISADQMGMFATVINGLALRDALEKKGLPASLMSAFAIPGIASQYDRYEAQHQLEQGRVVILSAGTVILWLQPILPQHCAASKWKPILCSKRQKLRVCMTMTQLKILKQSVLNT